VKNVSPKPEARPSSRVLDRAWAVQTVGMSLDRVRTADSWGSLVVDDFGNDDVFVLGAGFSRAVSDRMPLTDELGKLCLPHVTPDVSLPADFRGGRLETYLSELAIDQPYLSLIENMRNRALFEEFSGAIGLVLGARQNAVMGCRPPHWLVQFLVSAHVARAGVLTFNYDTLLECVAASMWGPLDGIDANEPSDPFFWDELTGGIPAWPPGPSRFGGTQRHTMRLLKLHGSLNWYWSPGDATGATIAKRDLPGAFPAPLAYEEHDRERELPGRVPFVVPPTAAKSLFYSTPLLHEIWSQAYTRLQSAKRVFLLGYSLPLTDLTTSSMFRDALQDTSSVVVIADLDASGVAQRVESLGIVADRIRVVDPQESRPIETVVGHVAAGRSSDVLRQLREAPDQTQELVVSWGNYRHAGVTRIHLEDDIVLLTTEPLQEKSGYVTRLRAESEPSMRTIRDLPQEGRLALCVQLDDGTRQHLVGHRSYQLAYGRSEGWRILQSAGLPNPEPPGAAAAANEPHPID